ncbi:methyltransferase family protein [Desulfospira joergensenii]|uniref:methyltransferase family protein n=1 Tax=Desulfospira joergensenii TaxID=53329 RepID=UPI0003B3024F|nr:isoprenylcysteine carboxylmethyltransferase family protein [Desulfospira joergensenii]
MIQSRQKSGILRHAAGYFIGIGLFLILIPLGIVSLASSEYRIFSIPILPYLPARVILSALFFIPGAVFVLWSNLFLFSRGKGGPTDIAGLSISPRTKKLVMEGPYRYTRNPMVFGVHSIYAALSLYLNSLGCLLVLILFFLTVVRLVVLKEEKRLEKDFGSEYAAYRKKTPMFFPRLFNIGKKG